MSAPVFTDLTTAVADHVRPGDVVHVVFGHSRWTALLREVARQHWGRPSELTLAMASLGSVAALLFEGGCLAKVVTLYSGDAFPAYTPNPVFQKAYRSGKVEVEHWSFLPYIQRLKAAAQGLPAMTTGSLAGSSMQHNPAYQQIDTEFGTVGLVQALAPDVTLVHAAVADSDGNIAMAPPLLEGVHGAYAARRGVVATVEGVVDDLRDWAPHVVIPAHRVLAVVEAPFGAHPGGLYVGRPGAPTALPARPYDEDIPFWTEAGNATRGNFEIWAKEWCLSLDTHQGYLDKLGVDRLERLAHRATPNAWREDAASLPIDQSPTPHRAELVAIHASRALVQRITDSRADAVLAGAGLANLAAWSAVAAARDGGVDVHLTAEMGMWDYHPVPADPYIFNFRTFPSATSLSDADHILGTLVGGPGTRSIGCIGCGQFDRHGNLNSTDIPDGPFLVGSGGANDVATLADETLVVAPLTRRRAVEAVGYVTSPGQLVRTVATDKGVLSKDHHGELVLTTIAAGPGSSDDRIRDAIDACGWPLTVARQVHQEPAVQQRELTSLRTFDRRGAFLQG